jgi:hypothetical protein
MPGRSPATNPAPNSRPSSSATRPLTPIATSPTPPSSTGVILVWLSRIWTTRDKLVGTVGGLSWVLAGLGTISISAGSRPVGSSAPLGPAETNLLEVVLFVLPFVLPIAAAIYLGIRLRGRTAARSATG